MVKMFKVIAICSKCEKETAAYDDGEGIIVFDFGKSIIIYSCPLCGNENIINVGNIEQLLNQKTKLPGLRGSRF